MREHPILFKDEMVRAILEGRKTQTRRVINMSRLLAVVPRPIVESINGHRLGETRAGRFRIGLNPLGAVFKLDADGKTSFGLKPGEFDFVCPYAAGRTWITPKTPERSAPWTITPDGSQQLWVRETYAVRSRSTNLHDVLYRANVRTESPDAFTGSAYDGWRPSIFMPRWASRITLEVIEVRVQRVQNICEYDARAEGVDEIRARVPTARDAFHLLWDDINGETPGRWEANPWVWAITFRRCTT